MRRREILALLGGAAMASSSAMRAAAEARPAHIGFISGVDKAAAADLSEAAAL
jgi:hypothetical protein